MMKQQKLTRREKRLVGDAYLHGYHKGLATRADCANAILTRQVEDLSREVSIYARLLYDENR
jgi:hypothetical protein